MSAINGASIRRNKLGKKLLKIKKIKVSLGTFFFTFMLLLTLCFSFFHLFLQNSVLPEERSIFYGITVMLCGSRIVTKDYLLNNKDATLTHK